MNKLANMPKAKKKGKKYYLGEDIIKHIKDWAYLHSCSENEVIEAVVYTRMEKRLAGKKDNRTVDIELHPEIDKYSKGYYLPIDVIDYVKELAHYNKRRYRHCSENNILTKLFYDHLDKGKLKKHPDQILGEKNAKKRKTTAKVKSKAKIKLKRKK